MKILHLVPSYWPAFERGGPIRSVHLLNKWLVKNGVDVTVYTTSIGLVGKIETNKEVLVDGVKVWYFPLTWRAWQYSSALHKKLKQTVKDFNLIHITSTFLAVSTLGAYYAKKFGVPYLISPRGNLMKEPLKKKSPLKKRIYIALIEKKNLAGASAIHFTTEAEKREYLEQNLPFKKAIIIPNGLDPEEFGEKAIEENKINFREKFGIAASKKIVLSLGRINWKKGFDSLIPIFAEVIKEEKNAVLVIVGEDDGYLKELENLIKNYNLKINENVFFTGQLLGEERIAAYRDSDVFVLPSYSENFGMVFVESMASGTPAVGTTTVGIAPFIQDSQAGIILEKGTDEKSIQEWKDEIIKTLRNPEKTKEKGKKLVKDKFMMPKIAEEWVNVYDDLINKK